MEFEKDVMSLPGNTVATSLILIVKTTVSAKFQVTGVTIFSSTLQFLKSRSLGLGVSNFSLGSNNWDAKLGSGQKCELMSLK